MGLSGEVENDIELTVEEKKMNYLLHPNSH